MTLLFSPTFMRESKRLFRRNLRLGPIVEAVLKTLESNVFAPNLKTHKLKGKFEGYWSCSVEYDVRIIFKIVKADNENAVLLLSIGTHDDVY